MNRSQSRADDGLLTMVDFKWLMAGLGWRVDLTRMRRDAGYLGECARRGLASDSPLLRERSADLLRLHSARQVAAPSARAAARTTQHSTTASRHAVEVAERPPQELTT